MKILFLVKYYENYQKDFLKSNPDFPSLSYAKMMERLHNDFFVQFNSFVFYMNKKGVDAQMIVPNFKIVQKQWAKENESEWNSNWKLDIASQQVKNFKPDIFFLNSNFEYYGSFLKDLKPFYNKVCAWISCPFNKNMNLDDVDFIFTLFKPHYNYFTSIQKPCKLTHAGFDPRISEKLEKKESIDLSFIGGIGGYHRKREEVLKKVMKQFPIKIWGYGYQSNNRIKSCVKTILNGGVYLKAFQGQAWGIRMFQVLSDSKISINIHGDIASGHAVNMRMFETTGVGTLLITEYAPNIEKYYIPDKEIICYKTVQELKDKIQFYLENKAERKKIAMAGQKKTLEKFSHEKLADDYLDVFEKLLLDETAI